MLSSRVGNDVLGAHAMCQLARLRESLGLPGAAAEHYQRGIDIAESVRARLGSPAERAALANVTADLYANAARFAHGRSEALDAFRYAEAGRARLVLDRRAEEAAGMTADPELRERRRALAAEIGSCARELERLGVEWVKAQAAQPVDETALENETAEALGLRLQELEAEWRTVETTLTTGDARFAARAGAGIDAVWDVATVQEELLGDQSILLEYLVIDERCLLFAITNDEFSVFEVPLEVSELTGQIEELCDALEQTAAGFPHGHSLYRALIEPAAELIANKRDVLISPDGALNRLPFAVLLREEPQSNDDENGPYFAHRWNDLPYFLQDSIDIRYIASATTEGMLRRAESAERPTYRSGLLALGAPLAEIDGPAAVDFPPLPLVPVELDAIAEPFQHDQTVVQPRENGAPGATRTGALQLLDGDPHGYRFVHFATHALLDGAQPWRSALVFEPDDGDRAVPGFLHANETVDLALPAECVTMSGCHTLGSEASAGEGVVGLSLAFRHAGARSVCASLWAVADRSTAELMRLFYSRLEADGLTPPAALAAAQRALIAEGYHPRRWAAFGIFG
jgi:CHAT domain-containing protein